MQLANIVPRHLADEIPRNSVRNCARGSSAGVHTFGERQTGFTVTANQTALSLLTAQAEKPKELSYVFDSADLDLRGQVRFLWLTQRKYGARCFLNDCFGHATDE